MVGQLNPVSNAQTSNNSFGNDYSNNSSDALTDTNVVHTFWVLAIILSLAFPQIYTISSCFWIKCHKRNKKTDGDETQNTNEDSNMEHRRWKDWVLVVGLFVHQIIEMLR